MLFASLLSIICLAKGAVYDSVVAMALIASIPVLWLAARDVRSVHSPLAWGTVLIRSSNGGAYGTPREIFVRTGPPVRWTRTPGLLHFLGGWA